MNRFALSLIVLSLAATGSYAQSTVEPRTGDVTGWHVVRPGETLQKVTQQYLGTPHLWPENHRLNPQVSDPHLLRIGQRLRVILHRELPPRTAQLTQVHNQVEERPMPNPWQPALVGDLLKEQDGVRTLGNGSAEIKFDDGVRVILNEHSLVYLRRMDQTLRTGKRESIEIVRGQADLTAAVQDPSSLADIEIVLGSAINRPRPDNLGRAETRSRLEDSGAAVMVYSGSGELASGDQAVAVGAGEGTRVADDGSVAPPSKLLPAPSVERPQRQSVLPYANPEFRWEAVDQGIRYQLEVCADLECGTIQATAETDQTKIELQLPEGTWYWRVRAVDDAGLDGFPSGVQQLQIDDARPDRLAPAIAIIANGSSDSAQSVRVVQGESLTLSVVDDVSGLESLRYRWDDGAWRTWDFTNDNSPVLSSPGLGEHLLEVEALDVRGRIGISFTTISIVADRPQPPVFAGDD